MDCAKEDARAEGSGAGRGDSVEVGEHMAHGRNDVAQGASTTPLNDAALPYRRARLDLIPVKARDKAPADARWQLRAYDHAETLARVRRDGLNLGVRLPADVVVVDVDPRNFPEGRDSLAELTKAVGLNLSAAPHVVTGNLQARGHHYYFRKPAAATLLDSIDGYEGVEFKSLGRQVVAAGSVHPTGGRYEWAPDSPPLHDMPDLPHPLIELARKPERKKSASAGEITPEQLATSLEHLAPEDFRDQGTWLELMMACHHATDGEGRQEFIDWSTSDPMYADHEWIVGRRWDSLHSGRDDAITIGTLRKRLLDVGADIAHPEPEDEFEVWIEDEEAEGRSARWKFLTMQELEALPPPTWLVDGLLTEMSLGAIYGPPETFKSFLAIDICMSIAGGLPWHGRAAQRGAVLYIAAEGASGLGKRVRAWKQHHGAEARDFALRLMRDEINFAADSDAVVRAFAEEIRHQIGPLKLIVIDTLNQTAAGADENAAKDMGRYIASMKRLRDATGAAVVVIHHSGKEPSKGPRGSTALPGAMDTMLQVECADDRRSIKVCISKQKDAERGSPMRFLLEKIGDSLVLRPCVMADAAADFTAQANPLLDLVCEMALGRHGRLHLKDLIPQVMERDGCKERAARRRIEDAIPLGRGAALRASDGTLLWMERVDNNPRGELVIRADAEAA